MINENKKFEIVNSTLLREKDQISGEQDKLNSRNSKGMFLNFKNKKNNFEYPKMLEDFNLYQKAINFNHLRQMNSQNKESFKNKTELNIINKISLANDIENKNQRKKNLVFKLKPEKLSLDTQKSRINFTNKSMDDK